MIVPFIKPDPKCSFCGTLKSVAKKFVESSTGVCICGACIAAATKRIKETEETNDIP